jgi:hypothetical protein
VNTTNPGPTDLDLTLKAIARFVRRFVVLSDDQLAALALYVVHTHAYEAAETTPYVSASSAEKRSGKTRLLEVLELLVGNPLPTSNISDAALFRAIAERKPTLLFDEIDAIFGPRARDREDLRGMLNAGYRRGAVALRMGGQNMRTLEAFPVYCPKVFAGIGELPDTIRDRCIRIRLERRTRDERIERFRRRDALEQAESIRQSVESLAAFHADALTYARPGLPNELDDRAQDVWEPLLAIAELAGGDWSARARAAAVALSTGEERGDDSLGVRLLADIRDVFESNRTTRYPTADLITELAKVEESPWGDWFGKTISPQAIGKLLKPYRIKTMPVWVDGETHRGYKLEQFKDAWLRVLGVRGVRGVRGESPSGAAPNTPNTPNTQGAEGEKPLSPLLGDVGYPLLIDVGCQNGHITEGELAELQALERLVRHDRDRPEPPPPLADWEADAIATGIDEAREQV